MYIRGIYPSTQGVVIIVRIRGRSVDYLEIRLMELVRIIKRFHGIRANSI